MEPNKQYFSWKQIITVLFSLVLLPNVNSILQAETAICNTEEEMAAFRKKTDEKKIARGKRDEKLKVNAMVRVRFEELKNFTIKKYNTGEDDNFLLWRLRLCLDYKIEEHKHAFLQLQDNRYTGSKLTASDFPGSCPYENQLDIRQGFYEQTPEEKGDLGFRLGRQIISYGDQRVFAAGEWGNTGRYTWDALKLTKHIGKYDIDIITGKMVTYEPESFDNEHSPDMVYAAYASRGGKKTPEDFFYIYRSDNDALITGESGIGGIRRHTIGTHQGRTVKTHDFMGTAAFQFGDEGADNVRAYGYHLGFGETLRRKKKLRFGFDYSVASGDSSPTDGKNETFDSLYTGVGQYYGKMNLINWMNLEDIQFSVSCVPQKNWNLCLDFHRFNLNDEHDSWYNCGSKTVAHDPTGASGDYIGKEIDFVVKYKANRNLNFAGGIAHFSPGSFSKSQGLDNSADWIFLQTLWKF